MPTMPNDAPGLRFGIGSPVASSGLVPLPRAALWQSANRVPSVRLPGRN